MITTPFLFSYFEPEKSLFFCRTYFLKKKFKTVLPHVPNPKWEGQIACMEEKVPCTRFWLESVQEKKNLKKLDLEENIIQYYINIILKIYFKKQDEKARSGLMWLQLQKNGGLSSNLKKLRVL